MSRESPNEPRRKQIRRNRKRERDAAMQTFPLADGNEAIPIDIPERIDIILGYVALPGGVPLIANDQLRRAAHVKLLVPFRTNRGRRVSHRMLEKRIVERAGGFHAHNVRGVWRDPETGKVERERMRAYDITLKPDAQLGDIRAFEEYVKAAFEQKNVYLTVTPTITTNY